MSEGTGRGVVRALSMLVDSLLVIILCLPLTLGCYALWDTQVVYERAEKDLWTPYKPTEPEPLSFWELQRINPEVRAWLTVYGSGIDYPVCQSSPEDESKYLTCDAKGEYSLSGALFIDETNAGDFSDFATIVYGHHMENGVMFGSITDFAERAFFDEHRYGNLFVNDDDAGLEFFCYLDADAYDATIYRTAFSGPEARQGYLDLLRERARLWRDAVEVTEADRIVLLSTCATGTTNGRAILVGKLSQTTYKNPYVKIPNLGTGVDVVEGWLSVGSKSWLLAVTLVVCLVLLFVMRMRGARKGGATS